MVRGWNIRDVAGPPGQRISVEMKGGYDMDRAQNHEIATDLFGKEMRSLSDEVLVQTYQTYYQMVEVSDCYGVKDSLMYYASEAELMRRGYRVVPQPCKVVKCEAAGVV